MDMGVVGVADLGDAHGIANHTILGAAEMDPRLNNLFNVHFVAAHMRNMLLKFMQLIVKAGQRIGLKLLQFEMSHNRK